MNIDKAKLQPLLWAVVGAWRAGDQDLHLRTDALDGFLGEHTVEEVALGLLAEVERLEGCEEVLRNLVSYVGADAYSASEVAPEVFARKIMDGINILNDPLAQLAEKRGAERDQLAADNESLRGSCKAMGLDMGKLTRERNSFRRSAEKLKAENEVLRKDAERYRWLRDECGVVAYKEIAGSIGPGMLPSGEKLEAAIDAAKEREACHV
ncbi:hypothetical protein [Pseudomonas sp. R32]|uniref:hypothetical protein n=1 Tax=Pseudomonas sp. R32 TaxID=1573704 RepID=UPI00132E9AC9|nr:hypothetical protein [Pseudomonas sp. R32]QHF28557.1 hypothetical protein PspR32_12385 [Pseudomonas sp. R32]